MTSNAPSSMSTDANWPTGAIPKSWVEKLFEEMLLSFGKRFTDQWSSADPEALKRYWGKAMAALSNDEMRRGVSAMRTKDWPPTLNEFIKLCRPAVDPQLAYYEALEQGQLRELGESGTWSSPAIYWAWHKIGPFDFGNLGYAALRPRWEKALADQVALGEWQPIPQPALALAAPGQTEMNRDEVVARMVELKASSILKRSDQPIDHLRWARDALARDKRGDKTVSLYQLKSAREALGVKAS